MPGKGRPWTRIAVPIAAALMLGACSYRGASGSYGSGSTALHTPYYGSGYGHGYGYGYRHGYGRRHYYGGHFGRRRHTGHGYGHW